MIFFSTKEGVYQLCCFGKEETETIVGYILFFYSCNYTKLFLV